MSKYDSLDPRKELEQTITEDLKKALEKRGFIIKHNGTKDSAARGNMTDIEVFDKNTHVNVEVTKTVKSSSYREMVAIKKHLDETIKQNTGKNCFIIYISPETDPNMINNIKEHNQFRKDDAGGKIIPLSFSNFELFQNKLKESEKDMYTKKEILSLFDSFKDFIDDAKVLRVLYEKLFNTDPDLKKLVEEQEQEKGQKLVELLVKDLEKLEDNLRKYRIALAADAIKNVIFLVFMKLYQEKREYEEKGQNFFTPTSFEEFRSTHPKAKKENKAIHELFNEMKEDEEFKECKMFSEHDYLSDNLTDEFVMEFFIKPFYRYPFYKSEVDGLGAVYEVLGKRTGKDTKVGQFFTPENIVKFMVKLSEPEEDDVVLDPACGTARFLTHSMNYMINNLKGKNIEERKKKIRSKQLIGTDDDPNVARLAKMNMYINKDGKTNIKDKDGLLLYQDDDKTTWNDVDGKIDIILTNPPLGDISYQKTTYDLDFKLKRMEVIPKKNLTEERLKLYEKRLEELEGRISDKDSVKDKINEYKKKIIECKNQIENKKSEYIVTGNQMKGGALFINAAKHYLRGVRNEDEKAEWRGGKLLIILDEGILNTDNYKEVRDFIKRNFYIKAVISLTKDAFVPVSKTSTKTSILYAIKKEDTDAIQKEPVFFAYAEKVGIDTKGKICENHLFNSGRDILDKYLEFKKAVLDSYDGKHFNESKFKSKYVNGGEF